MFSAVFEWIGSAAGVVVALATAAAAVVKFHAWWEDRKHDGRLASAKALIEHSTDQPVQAFGRNQIIQTDFRRLSGIDRVDDLSAFIHAHTELGGGDLAWTRLRGARPFLKAEQGALSVREITRRDWLQAAASWCLAMLCALLGAFALAASIA